MVHLVIPDDGEAVSARRHEAVRHNLVDLVDVKLLVFRHGAIGTKGLDGDYATPRLAGKIIGHS